MWRQKFKPEGLRPSATYALCAAVTEAPALTHGIGLTPARDPKSLSDFRPPNDYDILYLTTSCAAHRSQSERHSMTKTNRFSLATLLLLVAATTATISYLPFLRICKAAEFPDDVKGGDNDNSVVILNGGGNKPKILALHGGGGNGAGFSRQQGVRDLVAALPQYEFVFANAPEAGGLWLRDPPSKAQPTTDPKWANKSISYLDRLVAEHGPFYGLMAYSQGAPMSLVYLAHVPDNTFQRVALFNGYAPTTHQGLLAYIDRSAPFATNTLVFSGANDVFASMSPGLAARFQSAVEIHSPTAGHHLPHSSDATFARVVSFFQSEVTTAKPTPINNKATTSSADDQGEDEVP